ncbi:MAG: hypothetical protein N2043_02285 [Ignavibacterium sp.]|nr:hypothetical protein [Ignavibacterium sp.]
MGFQTNYNVGGVIDLIRQFPYPLFPKKTIPFVKGFSIDVPAKSGLYQIEYKPDVEVEFVGISVACSGYREKDFWELTVNGEKLFETIYTKELPESHSLGAGFSTVFPVPLGSSILFDFHNDSRTSKTVWINMKFLR